MYLLTLQNYTGHGYPFPYLPRLCTKPYISVVKCRLIVASNLLGVGSIWMGKTMSMPNGKPGWRLPPLSPDPAAMSFTVTVSYAITPLGLQCLSRPTSGLPRLVPSLLNSLISFIAICFHCSYNKTLEWVVMLGRRTSMFT